VDPISVITWGVASLVWLFFGCATVFVASYVLAIFQQHRDEQSSMNNSAVQDGRNMQTSEVQKCVLHLEVLSACRHCVTDIRQESRQDERRELIEEIIRPDPERELIGMTHLIELIKARGEC